MHPLEKELLGRLLTLMALFTLMIAALFIALFAASLSLSSVLFFVLSVAVIGVVMAYLFARVVLEPSSQSSAQLEALIRDTLHELNLPLATIKANLQMLEKLDTDDKSRRRIERIGQAAEELAEHYEELDRQIRRSLYHARIETVELASFIDARVAMLGELAGGMKIQTALEPWSVRLDRVALRQAVDNLLSNALKYNRPGGTIRVSLSGGLFEVRDEGPGIEEKELVRLFERYYQGDAAKEGQGIGLSLVKAFCDQWRIPIRIEPNPGIGSAFILDFSSRRMA